jgi:uncharacterized protein YkwD
LERTSRRRFDSFPSRSRHPGVASDNGTIPESRRHGAFPALLHGIAAALPRGVAVARLPGLTVTLLLGLLVVESAPARTQPTPAAPPLAGTPEQAVLQEINLARTHPRAYANILARWIPDYSGKILTLSGNRRFITIEGASAAREAVRFLRRQRPLSLLRMSPGMSRAARDHVLDQEQTGAIGHGGSRGDQVWDRVDRYGTWGGAVGEDIAYGFSDPREIVISLIIDDGVPGRGHRKNIFDPGFHVAGVAIGPHPRYGTMCDITFAASYGDNAAVAELQNPVRHARTHAREPNRIRVPLLAPARALARAPAR